MFKFPALYIYDFSPLATKELLKMVTPSRVKLPLLIMTAFLYRSLNPVIITLLILTLEFSSTVKKLNSVEFA